MQSDDIGGRRVRVVALGPEELRRPPKGSSPWRGSVSRTRAINKKRQRKKALPLTGSAFRAAAERSRRHTYNIYGE